MNKLLLSRNGKGAASDVPDDTQDGSEHSSLSENSLPSTSVETASSSGGCGRGTQETQHADQVAGDHYSNYAEAAQMEVLKATIVAAAARDKDAQRSRSGQSLLDDLD